MRDRHFIVCGVVWVLSALFFVLLSLGLSFPICQVHMNEKKPSPTKVS